MKDDLLGTLEDMHRAAHGLQTDTNLNFAQEQFAQSITEEMQTLIDMVIALPEDWWGEMRAVFSFEARSHLTSIIGYAEMLLDESDGPLDDDQMALAQAIARSGRTLLATLAALEG
ncbi:MAG: hypothetical protein ACOCXZ_00065 [Chloroflexota bacterium]